MNQFIPIPIAFDSYLGISAMPSIESQYGGVSPHLKVQAYVDSVGQKVRRHTSDPELPYTFKALSSQQINAFALPGGPIYVLDGLLGMMDSEDELGCVVAHECAHIDKRHSIQQLEMALGATGLLKGIDSYIKRKKGDDLSASDREKLQLVSGGLMQLAQMGFSRKHEYEADKSGVRYAAKSGYNPLGMVSFFEKLKLLSPGMNKFEEWTSSHPDINKRIEQVRATVSKEFPKAFEEQAKREAESKEKFKDMTSTYGWLPYAFGALGIGLLGSLALKRKQGLGRD